jgi:predicted RNA-binding Zn-ribbon protein involved in translation (DUF1610 family)
MFTCPYCGEPNDIRRARRHGLDWLLAVFFLVPYRCRDCRERFYRFRFLGSRDRVS